MLKKLVLVLFYINISCSPDKEIRPDTWKITKIKILNQQGLNLDEKLIKTSPEFFFQDKLFLESTENFNLKSIARCLNTKTGKTSNTTRVFKATHEIKFLNLIETKSFYTKKALKTKLNCQFELIATNALGSKHKFNLSNINLIENENTPSINIYKNSNNKLTSEIHIKNLNMNFFTRESKNSKTSQLICEDFSIQYQQNLYTNNSFSFFDFKNIKTKSKIDSRSNLKNNFILPIQTCRLINLNSQDQAEELSDYFQLHLEFPQLTNHITWNLKPFSFLNPIESRQILSLEIKNPYKFDFKIKIKEILNTGLNFKPISSDFYSDFNAPLWIENISKSTFTYSKTTKEFTILIKKNSSVNLTYHTNLRLNCFSLRHGGFAYHLGSLKGVFISPNTIKFKILGMSSHPKERNYIKEQIYFPESEVFLKIFQSKYPEAYPHWKKLNFNPKYCEKINTNYIN